mmetsp:Transcript_28858/g.52780  ORF Transcript_28858/g.52780 Transcript_28858/m.52780 type:complete len:201 (-) Transcript_28858:218-820(-)
MPSTVRRGRSSILPAKRTWSRCMKLWTSVKRNSANTWRRCVEALGHSRHSGGWIVVGKSPRAHGTFTPCIPAVAWGSHHQPLPPPTSCPPEFTHTRILLPPSPNHRHPTRPLPRKISNTLPMMPTAPQTKRSRTTPAAIPKKKTTRLIHILRKRSITSFVTPLLSGYSPHVDSSSTRSVERILTTCVFVNCGRRGIMPQG